MTIHIRTKSLIGTAQTPSRPVWAFVISETIIAMALAVFVFISAHDLAGAVDVTSLPPWRTLAVFPLAGVGAQLSRAMHPGEALRRWHGVVVRRVDQRWGDER